MGGYPTLAVIVFDRERIDVVHSLVRKIISGKPDILVSHYVWFPTNVWPNVSHYGFDDILSYMSSTMQK